MSTKNISLSIPFSLEQSTSGAPGIGGPGGSGCGGTDEDWLRVEQLDTEEPPLEEFELSRVSDKPDTFENAMLELQAYVSACNGEGDLPIEIAVFMSRPDIEYSIKASYGVLSFPRTVITEHDESINVYLKDCIPFGVKVVNIQSVTAEWEGDVISASGDFIIPKPEIHIDEKAITFDQVVIGTLRVKYPEEHDEYTLTITQRDNNLYGVAQDSKDAYASTVVVVWEGGVEVLEIEMPDNLSGNCGGGSTQIDPDEDEEKCIKITELRNPCTGELISTTEEEVDCPTPEEIEEYEKEIAERSS